ncbi:MAG: response regulator, partial [Rhodospirillales bacterium]|nr:response regulator [Rhodospirillales bacterium]
TVALARESDIVLVRQRARRIAELVGLKAQDRTRFTTALSEIARNAVEHAHGGEVEFLLVGRERPQRLEARVRDDGAGIPNLGEVLSGAYQSPRGMGVGILGARRLAEVFEIESAPGRGTTVTLGKMLPPTAKLLGAADIRRIADTLARDIVLDPLLELRGRDRELLLSLEELQRREKELDQISQELSDTNRGVVALYAELEERAEHLRRADEIKSRFLSHMSHEFRTPLNAVLALSKLLLDRVDGDLTPGQERQVRYIRRSAESLKELIDDLLDLAKVESGKTEVHRSEFTVEHLFRTLRGMMRPLLPSEGVALVFENVANLPPLVSDEGKISQILRNFVSNAIKFTERGEVRVSAERGPQDTIIFSVRDTGIGIAPEHHELIFQEFSQIESKAQGRVKGTGLGLPLSRRLAELLGGRVAVESALGEGSTFTLILPRVFGTTASESRRILVVDDDEAARYVLCQFLSSAGFEVEVAGTGGEGLERARREPPDAILLDLQMPDLDGYELMEELHAEPRTREIPIVVVTSAVLGPKERARLGRARAIVGKDRLSTETLVAALSPLAAA